MAEDKDSNFGELEKLALIADSRQDLFRGKSMVVFELETEEYKKMQGHFRQIDRNSKRFTIDISGTDFIFILDEDES